MNITKTNLVYFSATSTTSKVLRSIAEGIGIEHIMRYDITPGQDAEVVFGKDEIAVFGVPVYAGRIPQISVASLHKFKGSGTPAIVVCVYGNRDFDDALLELHDIVSRNGFKVISAGAFIAQHSIFPALGAGRPDGADKTAAERFGRASIIKLKAAGCASGLPDLTVKGNFPYKDSKPIPLKPRADRRCNSCGTCARMCPAHAIDPAHPHRTDKNRCISCARCIHVCPQHARHFGGLLYKMVSRKFTKAFAARKEPYTVY